MKSHKTVLLSEACKKFVHRSLETLRTFLYACFTVKYFMSKIPSGIFFVVRMVVSSHIPPCFNNKYDLSKSDKCVYEIWPDFTLSMIYPGISA